MGDPSHFGNRMFKVVSDQAMASLPKFMLPQLGLHDRAAALLQEEVKLQDAPRLSGRGAALSQRSSSVPCSPARPADAAPLPESDAAAVAEAYPILGDPGDAEQDGVASEHTKIAINLCDVDAGTSCILALGGEQTDGVREDGAAAEGAKVESTIFDIDAGMPSSLAISGEQTGGVRDITTPHVHGVDDGAGSEPLLATESRSAPSSVGCSVAVDAAGEADIGAEALAAEAGARHDRPRDADGGSADAAHGCPADAARGRVLTAFADKLVDATERAPERLAERLVEQLQQYCLEEAGMGLTSFMWDLPLPSGKRSFMNQAAREFVSRVEALGFERVEWWNGREWRQSQGRFHILHDTIYDKYHMRLRVRWLDRLPPEAPLEEHPVCYRKDSMMSAQSEVKTELEHIQHLLDLQRQMLEAAIAAGTGACMAGVVDGQQRLAAEVQKLGLQVPWPPLPDLDSPCTPPGPRTGPAGADSEKSVGSIPSEELGALTTGGPPRAMRCPGLRQHR